MRLTITRILARTFSRTVQSMVTLLRTAAPAPGRSPQRLVAQDLHGAVVDLQRVVEGDLVVGQPQILAALVRLAHLLASLISSSITCGGLDGPVLVALDGVSSISANERAWTTFFFDGP
jgi:hypothetical protein